jgi:hypothetical protein
MPITTAISKAAFLPWTLGQASMNEFVRSPATSTYASQWSEGQLSELGIVNIMVGISSQIDGTRGLLTWQGALVAAIVSSVFSWPTIADCPWTAKALFYATLVLSLFAVTTGFQQSVTLMRYSKHPEGLALLQKQFQTASKTAAGRVHLFVWQIPIMLVNISIGMFLLGVLILVWDIAAQKWGKDLTVGPRTSWVKFYLRLANVKQIAILTTVAGAFAFACYLVGTITIYVQKED